MTLAIRLCVTLTLVVIGACRTSSDAPVMQAVTNRQSAPGPKVLCVFAHPDDESTVAATLYKTATHLDGACDIFLITNGEGGFKYATLAESIYGVELTQEGPGRWYLPSIRRMELLQACKVLHVRNVWFMTQPDHRYTQDPLEVLGADAEVWDLPQVERELAHVLEAGDYDFVLTFAPSATTHGHHQAATVLAVQAVMALPAEQRPVLLGARVESAESGVPTRPEPLADFPETAMVQSQPALVFDRLEKFGHRDALDYRIVVNWAIAMHRSQGTMQLAMSKGLREHYFLFEENAPGAAERAVEWFEALATPQFETDQYGPSAGTNADAGADAETETKD